MCSSTALTKHYHTTPGTVQAVKVKDYWWSGRHPTKPQTVHCPSQQQLTATSSEQFSRALKTCLFTLDWAHPAASDSLFSLMNYGAVYKLNDWLINCKDCCTNTKYLVLSQSNSGKQIESLVWPREHGCNALGIEVCRPLVVSSVDFFCAYEMPMLFVFNISDYCYECVYVWRWFGSFTQAAGMSIGVT